MRLVSQIIATRDAGGQRREYFKARKAETEFAKMLRSVASHVGSMARHFGAEDTPTLTSMLARYAEALKPWATIACRKMLADVDRRDQSFWAERSRTMARELHKEIKQAPTGKLFQELMAEQVHLITSLPIEAAQRVHEWTIKGIEGAVRADEVAAQIMRTGLVTKNRANLIARTEVARTASKLLEARATFVGSEGYIWRTVGDNDVRNKDGNPVGSHRKLNGKFIRWDSPPVASTTGIRAHAGQIFSCRCFADPVIPEEP